MQIYGHKNKQSSLQTLREKLSRWLAVFSDIFCRWDQPKCITQIQPNTYFVIFKIPLFTFSREKRLLSDLPSCWLTLKRFNWTFRKGRSYMPLKRVRGKRSHRVRPLTQGGRKARILPTREKVVSTVVSQVIFTCFCMVEHIPTINSFLCYVINYKTKNKKESYRP